MKVQLAFLLFHEMASSRYWRIHYGPDYIDDEAYIRATVINKAIRLLIAKIGGSLGCKAHIREVGGTGCSCHEGHDPVYHVVAMLDAGGDMTESQLRERLAAECISQHKDVIKKECDFEAVDQLEYDVRCAH